MAGPDIYTCQGARSWICFTKAGRKAKQSLRLPWPSPLGEGLAVP